ncbi:MAG: DNA topoisomerase, partial [Clostridiales bacterium]|nr:DNA topoisomerase [Clostridiales bacterium]
MGKSLFIAEKPSVAQEFAKVLKVDGNRSNGYLESEECIVTWCVGHLVTMSYPDAYDPALKRWTLSTLPFIPEDFKYEIIPGVSRQFSTVKKLLNRKDVETIYVCTDSGREGEYIYRLVEQMAGVSGKLRRRVWIDSQTEEAILQGIRNAKDLTEYDNLASSAYLRAKEDYLIGINFSRLLTLKYGNKISFWMKQDRTVLSVGRVMTCVLGMVVRREREIRDFVKTTFYRVSASSSLNGIPFEAEWKAVPGSLYDNHPSLYRDNGLRKKEDAERLIRYLRQNEGTPEGEREISGPWKAVLLAREKKKERKNAPLLFNLAELQNVCSKTMKLSPDETLKIAQELYEKKLVTYPRTDARVLSTAVAREITKNIGGLKAIPGVRGFAEEILNQGLYRNIEKSRYTDDKKITDHYAIIPTGQGMGALGTLSSTSLKVYEKIVRRFLSIFFPPAEYEKYSLELERKGEHFFAGFRILKEKGFMKVTGEWKLSVGKNEQSENEEDKDEEKNHIKDPGKNPEFLEALSSLRKGHVFEIDNFQIREGETSPPKRYTSGSIILAMENAGQLIEDEELRAQIKGSGIGTSATRAEILKKLITIRYLALNKKTQ